MENQKLIQEAEREKMKLVGDIDVKNKKVVICFSFSPSLFGIKTKHFS